MANGSSGGETKATPSAWTLDTLKAHLETQINEVDKRHHDLLIAEHNLRLARREDDLRAIDKAEASMNKRLDAMNELRAQLNAQALTFVSIETFKADLLAVSRLIERNREDLIETRSLLLPRETFETALEQWNTWRQQVDRTLSTTEGRSRGVGMSAGVIVAALGAVLTVITIIVVLANVLTKP